LAASSDVDTYLAALPDEKRIVLEQLRQTIRAAAPQASETIAYQMPAFRLDGRFLVSYAAYKNHCSLFPASAAVVAGLADELKPYLAGKGTIRFRPDDPLPPGLVTRLVEIRVAETAASD
jgi:uncharacterized protein YdhG (YjbR/CyaY superfamily)